MANFNESVTKTLRNEGGFTANAVTGEVVNFGVTVWFLRSHGILSRFQVGPATADEVRFVHAMTRDYAIGIYRSYFWNPLHLDGVNSQPLADKIFDLAVNMGPGDARHPGAVSILQSVLGVAVDGNLGPQTVAALNAANADTLLASYRLAIAARYREIAGANPKLAADLPMWLARLAG